MRNALLCKAVVVVALAACVAVAGCGGGGSGSGGNGFGSVEGNVYVPSGTLGGAAADRGTPAGYQPLVGATVHVNGANGDHTAYTGSNGHFSVGGLTAGAATVTVTAPAGQSFRDLTTTVNVVAGGKSEIGGDGNVTLLSNAAVDLTVTIDSIDVSNWPTVRVTVSVLDPHANKALMGMRAGDFTLSLDGANASITGFLAGTSTGADSHRTYRLSALASGADASSVTAAVTAQFCSRTGSANTHSAMPAAFLPAIASTTVINAFKAAHYADTHPGKWHMGVDLQASANTRVSAVAVGQVIAVIIPGGSTHDTGVVVHHKLAANVTTGSGATRDIYVLYGCVVPTVGGSDVVAPGQQIGLVDTYTGGSRLHLGVRVGQDITSVWDGSLVGGGIPTADAYGLTDGWTDPLPFLAAHSPDNDWAP